MIVCSRVRFVGEVCAGLVKVKFVHVLNSNQIKETAVMTVVLAACPP